MEKGKKLAKNTAILAIGTICTKVLAFLVIPLYSRWLSVEDYGTFDLYSTYVTLLIPLLTLSCGEAVFRFLVEDEKNELSKKQIVSTSFAMATTGTVIGCAVISCISFPKYIKMVFLLYLISEVYNNYFLSYARGVKKLKVYAVAGIVMMFSSAVFVTLFICLLKFQLFGILLGYALAYFISSLYIAIVCNFGKYFRPQDISKGTLKKIVYYSTPLIPNTLCWWIMNVSDRSIVQWILGPSLLGIYAIACKIPSLCSTLFSVFQFSWLQSVSETINDEDRDTFYSSVLNNMIAVTSSICMGVLSVNFFMFDVVFAPKYSAGYWHVGILIPAALLATVASYLGGIFIGQKETGKNGSTTIFTAAINVSAHLLLINFIGIYAATVSTLVAYISLVVIRWCIITKQIKLKISKKSIFCCLGVLYFCVMQYVRILPFEIFNFILACVIFLLLNKNVIMGMLKSGEN